MPVFVLTHHPRASELKGDTPIEFVTEGSEAALERARAAAGERDVLIAAGASVARQALAAALVDELQVHIAPVLLGDGVRLFDAAGSSPPQLELERTIGSPSVTHIRYVVRRS